MVELEFIKTKGLEKEFQEFKTKWEAEENKKKVDYKFEGHYMLGDGDGDVNFSYSCTAEEFQNFKKYFNAFKEVKEVGECEDEWRPGAIFLTDQLAIMFDETKLNEEYTYCTEAGYCSTITGKLTKCKPVNPIKVKTLEELKLDEDADFEYIVKAYHRYIYSFEDMLDAVYGLYVKPWIENGCKEEDLKTGDLKFYV